MSDIPAPDQPFSSGGSQDPFQAAKASALKAAEELRNAAGQKARELRSVAEERAHHIKDSAESRAEDLRERADEFRGYADQAINDAKVKAADLRTEAENFAREKPLQALLSAFGVGFVVGLILRR